MIRYLLPAMLLVTLAACDSGDGVSATGASTAGTTSATTASVTATVISGATPTIVAKVSGNHLVDRSGNNLQLRGVNMSGLEFVPVQGGDVASWRGTIPNWSVYQSWKGNAVRIPLNVSAWLGLTTYSADVQGATSWGSAVNADPQGNYKQTVIAAVQAAQAIGQYVILDLHWSAPQVTLNGVTHYINPDGQPEFMNASTDLAFWTDIAKTFGTQTTLAGVSNGGVLFELFNEPYIDYYGDAATTYGCMLNGCTVATFHWAIGAYSVTPTGGVAMAGYQQALNAIRGVGAQNVVIINGPSWAQEGQNYKSWFPTDTLSTPQLAAGWHPYPAGTYPYSDGNVYGLIGNDTGGGTPAFSKWFEAILANGTPVLVTEDGGKGGTSATSGEAHMTYMMAWADKNNASYLAWEWTEAQAPGSNTTYNYMTVLSSDNTTIVPIAGEGVAVKTWLAAH